MRDAEAKIINPLVRRILDAGYSVSVRDEENVVAARVSRDHATIMAAIAHTDMTYLRVWCDAQPIAVITLVHGNDADVVADYTDHPIINQLVECHHG